MEAEAAAALAPGAMEGSGGGGGDHGCEERGGSKAAAARTVAVSAMAARPPANLWGDHKRRSSRRHERRAFSLARAVLVRAHQPIASRKKYRAIATSVSIFSLACTTRDGCVLWSGQLQSRVRCMMVRVAPRSAPGRKVGRKEVMAVERAS